MRICPECQEPLTHRKHKIFHCWECPEGHGTLYPRGELEEIVKAISGLGELEVRIWNDPDRYTALPSHLLSPENQQAMVEVHDREFPTIAIYADPVTHALWVHAGEEEKLVDHLKQEARVDSISSYLVLAAEEAAKVFDDKEPLVETTGHLLTALKLLGERILRVVPHITL